MIHPEIDFAFSSNWLGILASPTAYCLPTTHGSPLAQWTSGADGLTSNNLYTLPGALALRHHFATYQNGGVDLINLIAAGATIDGIELQIEGRRGLPLVCDICDQFNVNVELSWDAGTTHTASAKGANFTSIAADNTVTLGGPTDKWGRSSWVVGDFSAANFRVRLEGENDSNFQPKVDVNQLRVYFTSIPSVVIDRFGQKIRLSPRRGRIVF